MPLPARPHGPISAVWEVAPITCSDVPEHSQNYGNPLVFQKVHGELWSAGPWQWTFSVVSNTLKVTNRVTTRVHNLYETRLDSRNTIQSRKCTDHGHWWPRRHSWWEDRLWVCKYQCCRSSVFSFHIRGFSQPWMETYKQACRSGRGDGSSFYPIRAEWSQDFKPSWQWLVCHVVDSNSSTRP